MKRRRLAKLCVFLVLGAAVNVAVALAGQFLVPMRDEVQLTPRRFGSQGVTALEAASELTGRSPDWLNFGIVGCIHTHNVGYSWFMFIGPGDIHVLRAGYPFDCFHGEMIRLYGDEVPAHELTNGVWRVRPVAPYSSNQDFGEGAVPCHVIPVGFAANTAFYAAILWLLFAAPFALRRRRRIKRGLCPSCKYPVGASPVCTECGSPVKLKPAEAAS